jgi:hypothetical protein
MVNGVYKPTIILITLWFTNYKKGWTNHSFFMGKSTISKWPCSIANCDNLPDDISMGISGS